MQNEAPSLQVPASHRLEQHWVLSVHGLPAVWQALLSGWHKPALQLPPQQDAESMQARLSARHALALQRPALQASEQHSVDDAQAPPVVVHLLMEATQVADAGSQSPEQQSPPETQVWPKARHNAEGVASPTLVLASAVEVLPSGYLPTLAVLLQAAKASAAAANTMVVRMELGMATPVEGSIDIWNESDNPSRNRRHGIDCNARSTAGWNKLLGCWRRKRVARSRACAKSRLATRAWTYRLSLSSAS